MSARRVGGPAAASRSLRGSLGAVLGMAMVGMLCAGTGVAAASGQPTNGTAAGTHPTSGQVTGENPAGTGPTAGLAGVLNRLLRGIPSVSDLASVLSVAHDARTLQRLSAVRFPGAVPGTAQGKATHGPAPHAGVGSTAIPVYELSPGFVRGNAGALPGELSYVAVPAKTGAGVPAMLWERPTRTGSWRVFNVASGDREQRMAAALPAGAALLHEPQIDAWYAMTGGGLRLIDGGGAAGVANGTRYSLAEYQRLVHRRYAGESADSAYGRQGLAGGFGGPATRRVTGSQPTAVAHSADSSGPLLVLALGGGLVLLAAGAFFAGRRRT
ncbi:MAG: hypothetical protein ACRDRL_26880 [Sciscionella sp.]